MAVPFEKCRLIFPIVPPFPRSLLALRVCLDGCGPEEVYMAHMVSPPLLVPPSTGAEALPRGVQQVRAGRQGAGRPVHLWPPAPHPRQRRHPVCRHYCASNPWMTPLLSGWHYFDPSCPTTIIARPLFWFETTLLVGMLYAAAFWSMRALGYHPPMTPNRKPCRLITLAGFMPWGHMSLPPPPGPGR